MTAHDLAATGQVPDGPRGWYLRNGPHPAAAARRHSFPGDGMAHGVRLEGTGPLVPQLPGAHHQLHPQGPRQRQPGWRDLTAGPANTHLVRHASRTPALLETALPYTLTAGWDTDGP
ncbi:MULTISPECIES: carotenoid oxygenase family protein [unclassified Streptomyces]|uniref:carotenoid oxygenase family protein n=1 Tax=unclassified Streptomyces TaxID=2593676 RepID=UPI0034322D95